MRKFITVFLILIAALGFSSEAAAQNKPPSSPDTDAPEDLKKKLDKCEGELRDVKEARDKIQGDLTACLEREKAASPAPTAKKPTQIKCVGVGIKSDGRGGCECEEPTKYIAVVKKSFQEMVCVDGYEHAKQMELDIEALKSRGGDVSALEKKIEEIWAAINGDRAKLAQLISDFETIKTEIIEIKRRLDALEARGPGTLADSAIGVVGGFIARPGVGPGGFVALDYRQAIYFGRSSTVALVLEFMAGGAFSGPNGSEWMIGAGTGLRTDFTPDRKWSGTWTIQGKQFISRYGAGHDGGNSILNDPGMGYFIGPQAEIDAEPLPYLRVGLFGSVGYAQTNYWENGYLLKADGVAGLIGLNLSVHTDYGGSP